MNRRYGNSTNTNNNTNNSSNSNNSPNNNSDMLTWAENPTCFLHPGGILLFELDGQLTLGKENSKNNYVRIGGLYEPMTVQVYEPTLKFELNNNN